MLYLNVGLRHKVDHDLDNLLFLSQRSVISSYVNQFVILIYDSIEQERATFLFYIGAEFTSDQRSFVQFSRRRTEYLSNGLDARGLCILYDFIGNCASDEGIHHIITIMI